MEPWPLGLLGPRSVCMALLSDSLPPSNDALCIQYQANPLDVYDVCCI